MRSSNSKAASLVDVAADQRVAAGVDQPRPGRRRCRRRRRPGCRRRVVLASMPARSIRSPPETPAPSKAMAPTSARQTSRAPGAEFADARRSRRRRCRGRRSGCRPRRRRAGRRCRPRPPAGRTRRRRSARRCRASRSGSRRPPRPSSVFDPVVAEQDVAEAGADQVLDAGPGVADRVAGVAAAEQPGVDALGRRGVGGGVDAAAADQRRRRRCRR